MMIHDTVYRVILVGYWSDEYLGHVILSATAAKYTHTEVVIWWFGQWLKLVAIVTYIQDSCPAPDAK